MVTATCRYCGRDGELGVTMEWRERKLPELPVTACIDVADCLRDQALQEGQLP